MSDDTECDVCQKPGRRPRMKTCPTGWKWAEMKDSETGVVYIIASCSDECRSKFWKEQTRLE